MAGEVGNVFNGTMLFVTFAPMARCTLSLSHQGIMTSATAAKNYKGVLTLGEHFAASRPFTAAVSKLGSTRPGAAMLRGATRVSQFAERGTGQAVVVFGGEAAASIGASYLAGEYLGEEAMYVTDLFLGLGAGSSATWR